MSDRIADLADDVSAAIEAKEILTHPKHYNAFLISVAEDVSYILDEEING